MVMNDIPAIIEFGKASVHCQCPECGGAGVTESRGGAISITANKVSCPKCAGTGKQIRQGIRRDAAWKAAYLRDEFEPEALEALQLLTSEVAAQMKALGKDSYQLTNFSVGDNRSTFCVAGNIREIYEQDYIRVNLKSDGSLVCEKYTRVSYDTRLTPESPRESNQKAMDCTLSDLCCYFDLGNFNSSDPVQNYRKGYGLMEPLLKAYNDLLEEPERRRKAAVEAEKAARRREEQRKKDKAAAKRSRRKNALKILFFIVLVLAFDAGVILLYMFGRDLAGPEGALIAFIGAPIAFFVGIAILKAIKDRLF